MTRSILIHSYAYVAGNCNSGQCGGRQAYDLAHLLIDDVRVDCPVLSVTRRNICRWIWNLPRRKCEQCQQSPSFPIIMSDAQCESSEETLNNSKNSSLFLSMPFNPASRSEWVKGCGGFTSFFARITPSESVISFVRPCNFSNP